jgi:hypothetical protein
MVKAYECSDLQLSSYRIRAKSGEKSVEVYRTGTLAAIRAASRFHKLGCEVTVTDDDGVDLPAPVLHAGRR